MLKKNNAIPFFFTCLLLQALSQSAYASAEEKKTTPPSAEQKKELPTCLNRYLELVKDHPDTFGPFGKWQHGEIEITLNPEQIRKIENQTRLRLVSKGVQEFDAEKWSSVGVVAEDNYWIWVRDAVIFPSGVYGTYDRLMWKSGLDGAPGVAILPLLSTKKIVVNINYRHATRSWEIELPRGQKKEGESLEKAAARELKEETGYQISKCTQLGTMAPDTGTLMTLVPVFCGEVSHSGETSKEYSEAIVQNPAFSKEEIKQGFARGYIEVPIKGELVKVNCRDPFLTFALLQAEMKGLL
ncbi:MAG: NUDIX hydrolase [Verrucomicrobia bacterium]|nr:NUDIX hydrolase [Verrucomicrobiota bacterium]